MTVESGTQIFLAAAVAGAYFTIAAVVVPRLNLEEASPRYARLFRLAAVAFFIGCGLTHLHITVHAITDPQDVEAHELLFHVAQVGGGWLFIFAAVSFLDVKLVRRRSPEELKAEELEKRNAELTRSNAELAQFAQVVSHDLKQPLRTINGFNSMLARNYGEQLDEKGRHYIDESISSSSHMADLLEGILVYSKVGGYDLESEVVDCNAILAEIQRSLAEQIAAAEAEVEVEDLPPVWGDRAQISQIFQNLVSNAVKFNDQGDVRVSVRCLDSASGRHYFEVSDNGIGIDPKHRERVLKMFARLHTRQDYPGTGAGLSIVDKAIQRHGGAIEITEGPAGAGTSFRFSLPAVPEGAEAHAPGSGNGDGLGAVGPASNPRRSAPTR